MSNSEHRNPFNIIEDFIIFFLTPTLIGALLFSLLAHFCIGEGKLSLSEKIKYSDVAIIENKTYIREEFTNSTGNNDYEDKYYITITYKDFTKTFDNYTFYSSVEINEEIPIYIVEFWYKNELYKLDFHYKEKNAGKFVDF